MVVHIFFKTLNFLYYASFKKCLPPLTWYTCMYYHVLCIIVSPVSTAIVLDCYNASDTQTSVVAHLKRPAWISVLGLRNTEHFTLCTVSHPAFNLLCCLKCLQGGDSILTFPVPLCRLAYPSDLGIICIVCQVCHSRHFRQNEMTAL